MLNRLSELSANPGSSGSSWGWLAAWVALLAGVIGWATNTLVGGVVALWSFAAVAVLLALLLRFPYAVASPLFAGVLGWLVDMLPLVILVGWTAVVLRWAVGILRARRWPRGGRWIWLPVALAFWTGLGVIVITSLDFKHFLLLFGIQVVASGLLLACADQLGDLEDRTRLASSLVTYIIVLSLAVFLQWVGVNIEGLQRGETRKRVEAGYGVDAFPNNIGMIKYARSVKSGALELRRRMERVASRVPELPPYAVFRPQFQAYENSLVVRFQGSAREFESELARADVELLYDNVGLAPANTVPRMRSFPRNALTYAGACAALFPLAFYLFWNDPRRRRIGAAGIAACLFGSGFSLARGSWIAILIGIVYLLVDGLLTKRQRLQLIGAYLAAALILAGVYLIKYHVDPVTGRAGGGASVATREDLYKDTLAILRGPKKYIVLGYGTEQPRTESGTVKEGTRYVPRAGTHSTYLNYLFRTGIVGLILIVAIYATSFLHARAAAREHEGSERSFESLVAASVLIAGAHAVILSLYVEPIYTLVISALLGAAVAGAFSLGRSVWPWKDRTA